MPGLLSGDVDPTGLMSLLAPVITGGVATPPPAGMDPALVPQAQSQAANETIPAFLAAAKAAGSAAMPHYGPAPPVGAVLSDVLGAGYGAATQARMIPYLQQGAQLSTEQRELALQQQMFDFQRDRDTWNAFRGFLTPGTVSAADTGPQTGGPPPTGPNALSGVPASTQDLAALPEAQRIADSGIRMRAIQTANTYGMTLPAAQQWFRQLQVESGGKQYDADGKPITSNKGAIGVGQLMPGTFADMSKQYPDVGTDITDPFDNLKASGRYFMQGLHAANGDLAGAASYYVGGPGALTAWQSGKPGADVADYVVRTGAGGGAGGTGGGGGNVSALGPMVSVPMFGQLPQQIAQQVQAAIMSGMAAHDFSKGFNDANEIVTKYRSSQVAQLGPGQQVNTYSGQVSEAPRPTQVVPMTPAEIKSYGLDSGQPYVKTVYPDGTLAKPPELVQRQTTTALMTPEEKTAAGLDPSRPYYKTTYPNGELAKPPEPAPYQPDTAPMSDEDRKAYFPNAPSNVGAYWEVDPNTGKRTPTLAGGARGSQQLYTRISDQNTELMGSQPMKNLQTAEAYSRGVINGLNSDSAAGDIAAIESLFKVYDPSATMSEGKWQIASSIGGYAGQLQALWAKLQGDSPTRLTDPVRQQITDLMNSEMKSREGQVGQQITMQRGNYAGDPGEAAQIGRGWRPQYISAGDQEAQDLPAGAAPSTTGVIGAPNPAGRMRWQRGPLGQPPGGGGGGQRPAQQAQQQQQQPTVAQSNLQTLPLAAVQAMKGTAEYRSNPQLKADVDAELQRRGAS